MVTPTTPATPTTLPTSTTTTPSFREENEKPVEKEEVTSQSVINSYSPHSKKVKNANKLTPIPKEMYGPESVISRTYTSPLSMPQIKPFMNNASPRNLGYVVSSQDMLGPGDISASKPQVIVKPERRDLQWSKHPNLPVLKPQPHFSNHETNPTQNTIIPPHALASINQQLYKDQQQQLQQQQLKKNELFNSFKPGEQFGHAFKNATLFSKPGVGNMPNISSAAVSEYNAFANLQRHFYPGAATGEKPEMLGPDHRPSQEAAHSLLQLARPSFKGGNPALDQLQYFSRMNSMPVISSTAGGQPPTFPPPRFSTDNKEELAKLAMSFPPVGNKFSIPQVGKFR